MGLREGFGKGAGRECVVNIVSVTSGTLLLPVLSKM